MGMRETVPGLPGTAGTRLVSAGVGWDAVKVARFFALQAIEMLSRPGAVAVDPGPAEPVLYFFVPVGSTADWRLPQVTTLGTATHLVLPPAHCQAPPGPYWLVPPAGGRLPLTDPTALHRALAAVLGPREEQLS
ncbi:hypothetical protein SAZ_34040 [Streptomyces noursei ZPM]|uniref:Uncharacterized protein n=1 Tax=Streptomyces noursei TaxID=1971 RepID=A0A401RAM3_STRNR|nr:hypothetical protein SAZ_34040 [Streptomyces noursei ZPM]EPY93572.1 hypothetical protein K530_47360 [Streptomyces noursei CCRC 11814]GCB94705.1 hypothetical protein SALB_07506 [Streptomyces noursei]